MRKVQISRQLRTTPKKIRRLGERFNTNDITNYSTRTERMRVTTHGRDRYSATTHLRDRLMPAVVTARTTPGIQQMVRSVRQGCAMGVNANGRQTRH